MKKLITMLTLVLISSLGINQANATQISSFGMDFSVLDSDFGSYASNTSINYDSIIEINTWITQSLGSDHILGNGDTFIETGFMNLSTLSPSGTPFLYDMDNSLGYGSVPYKYVLHRYYWLNI